MLRINDLQKHKVFQRGNYMTLHFVFADHQLEVVNAVKFLQSVITNLNLKGKVFLYTLYW